MIADQIKKERIKFLLLGVLLVLGALFLMGATDSQVVIDEGRYQISAWGDGTAHGAFIVDTLSGETRIAYRYKELGDKKLLEINNLNEPFIKIKY